MVKRYFPEGTPGSSALDCVIVALWGTGCSKIIGSHRLNSPSLLESVALHLWGSAPFSSTTVFGSGRFRVCLDAWTRKSTDPQWAESRALRTANGVPGMLANLREGVVCDIIPLLAVVLAECASVMETPRYLVLAPSAIIVPEHDNYGRVQGWLTDTGLMNPLELRTDWRVQAFVLCVDGQYTTVFEDVSEVRPGWYYYGSETSKALSCAESRRHGTSTVELPPGRGSFTRRANRYHFDEVLRGHLSVLVLIEHKGNGGNTRFPT